MEKLEELKIKVEDARITLGVLEYLGTPEEIEDAYKKYNLYLNNLDEYFSINHPKTA